MTEEEYEAAGFLLEDLIKTIEVAEKKLEQNNTASSSPNLTNNEKQKIIKKLATDKTELKIQREKLENQVPINNLDQTLRDQLLAENVQAIAERDKELT